MRFLSLAIRSTYLYFVLLEFTNFYISEMKLYLEVGNSVRPVGELMCPVESGVVLFILEYCHLTDCQIVFVIKQETELVSTGHYH